MRELEKSSDTLLNMVRLDFLQNFAGVVLQHKILSEIKTIWLVYLQQNNDFVFAYKPNQKLNIFVWCMDVSNLLTIQ